MRYYQRHLVHDLDHVDSAHEEGQENVLARLHHAGKHLVIR